MNTIAERLDAAFLRAFGSEHSVGSRPSRATLAAWDSLGHVRLVMEIETEFGLRVGGADFAALHADFDTVVLWLDAHTEASTAVEEA